MKNETFNIINPYDLDNARRKFYELDGEEKLEAIQKMFHLSKTYNWIGNIWWNDEEDIAPDIEQGYNPDEYFSFFVIDGSVIVKITI